MASQIGFTNLGHELYGRLSLKTRNVPAHPPQQEMNCPRHSPAVDSITPTTYLRATKTVIILVTDNENLHSNRVALKPAFSCLSIPTLKTSVEIYIYHKHKSKQIIEKDHILPSLQMQLPHSQITKTNTKCHPVPACLRKSVASELQTNTNTLSHSSFSK